MSARYETNVLQDPNPEFQALVENNKRMDLRILINNNGNEPAHKVVLKIHSMVLLSELNSEEREGIICERDKEF